jgi:acetolactate synthase-1/2/3 large subunit
MLHLKLSSGKTTMKLSDYVMQTIANQGVRDVFFVPGGGAMHLNDSLGRCPELNYFSCIHEQVAAIAAEAYAKVTEGLGVAMVTTGPGGTNAITGLAGAWLDSTPVVFLSGQVKRADIMGDSGLRQLGSQEIDIVSLVKPLTKYAVTVWDPSTIRFHLEKALYLARAGRPGPVWIDIPLDVQAAEIADDLPGFTPDLDDNASPSPNGEQIARIYDLLNRSSRPAILVGNGVRVARSSAKFLQMAELLGIPVLTTWLGMDLITENHPLFAGRPGAIAPRGANFTLQNSDFLMTIGARMDMAQTGYAHDRFARGAAKVVVDIDEAEIRKLKLDIAEQVVCDAGDFISAMIEHGSLIRNVDRSEWFARITQWNQRYPLAAPDRPVPSNSLSAYTVSRAISDELPRGMVIAPGSSGFGPEIFYLMLQIKSGQRCFHNRGTGSMGFAIPSAIGACIASGRKETVSVDGDGGFFFNIQELATAASLNLPIKFFVYNNNGYASIRSSQTGYFKGNLVGCDPSSGLKLPDITAVSKAFGVQTAKIVEEENLHLAVRRVLERNGPVVCEVVLAQDEPRVPRLASSQRPDGTMVSRPLEDLFPFLPRDEFASNMIVPTVEEN